MTIFMLLCQTLSMKKVGMVVCLLLFASACGGASETLTPTSTSDLPTTTVTSTTAATPTTTVVSTTTVSPATTSMPAPSTSVVTTTTYVATTTTADTPTMSIANITNDTDFEIIDNSEVNLHLSFSCIAKELGGETWFSLWNRPVTSEESQKIQHCPTPSHNFPCVDNVLGMNKSDALIQDRYDPTEDDIELIKVCKIGSPSDNDSSDNKAGSTEEMSSTGTSSDISETPSEGQNSDNSEVAESSQKLFLGTLVDVQTPTVNYQIDTSDECSKFTGGECSELQWERVTGLRTGVVGALTIAPSNPDVIYAGFDSNDMSVWRSDDAGATWFHVAESAHVSGVAVKPTDANTVIHGVIEGDLLFSSEGGSESDIALSLRGTNNYRFSAVAYAPNSPEIAYSSSSGRREGSQDRRGDSAEVYLSSDSGQNWTLAGICGGCGVFHTIVVDPSDKNLLYAATVTGVRRSSDGGATWSNNLLTGLTGRGSEVLGIAIKPDSTGHILAATSEHGVFRSDDSGTTWVESNQGLETDMTHKVVYSASDPNVVYLTTHNGVYRSEDGGRNWKHRSDGLLYEFVSAIAVDPRNADVAYVGTASELHLFHTEHEQEGLHRGEGIYKTVDGGLNWFLSDRDIEESNLIVMTPHPKLPFEMWTAASAGRGGFITTSAGGSWLFSASDAAHYPMVFAYSHSFPSIQYLTSLYPNSEFIRSDDGGETWKKLGERLRDGVSQQTRESGLYNPNKAWRVHSHGLAVAPSDSNIVYVGTISDSAGREDYSLSGAHIFRSKDGGETFTEVSNGFPTETATSINSIVIHPTNPDIVYLMTSSFESEKGIGIYKTVTGGNEWFSVNNGLDRETNDIQIDPINPEILYAATANGIYKTVNGGNSWESKSDGLLDGVTGFPERRQREVFDLALNPLNPMVLYAAGYMGVYKSKNGGDSWYLVNRDLPIYSSRAESAFDHDRVIEIDASGKVIYAVVGTREQDRLDTMLLYRAILGTPEPFLYKFSIEGEFVSINSTSHLSNLIVNKETQVLGVTASGPVGTTGNFSIALPEVLLPGPFSVEVDGRSVTADIEGQATNFSFSHTGEDQIIVLSSN
jgi:photosystem II stability/assembly factor-like uncharacterized protein